MSKGNWNAERIARLGVLAGAGASVEEIAQDFGLSDSAIYKAARRLGIIVRRGAPDATERLLVLRLPESSLPGLQAAARRREIDLSQLASRLLCAASGEGADFIDNVMDDRGTA